VKSRWLQWAGHVERIERTRNARTILEGGGEPPGRLRRKSVDDIKIDHGKIDRADGKWTVLTQDRVQWWDLVLTVLNLRVPLPELLCRRLNMGCFGVLLLASGGK